MEIGLRIIQMIGKQLGPGIFGCHSDPVFGYYPPAYLGSKIPECLPHVADVAVNVQMVGIHRSDDGNLRIQLEERPVELVRLSHHGIVVAHKQIGPVILGNAAEEGRAADPAVSQDMCRQSAGRGLSVGSRHGQAALPSGDLAQNPGTLQQSVAPFPDLLHFAERIRDCRSIDHQCAPDIFRNEVRPVFEMHADALLLQFRSQI